MSEVPTWTSMHYTINSLRIKLIVKNPLLKKKEKKKGHFTNQELSISNGVLLLYWLVHLGCQVLQTYYSKQPWYKWSYCSTFGLGQFPIEEILYHRIIFKSKQSQ